jgi:hypothetical protein
MPPAMLEFWHRLLQPSPPAVRQKLRAAMGGAFIIACYARSPLPAAVVARLLAEHPPRVLDPHFGPWQMRGVPSTRRAFPTVALDDPVLERRRRLRGGGSEGHCALFLL